MLAFNKAVSCNTAAATPTLLAVKRLLQTTTSTCKADATGTSAGSAGSKGAAPGRATGKDEDVKFGGDPDGCECRVGVFTQLAVLCRAVHVRTLPCLPPATLPRATYAPWGPPVMPLSRLPCCRPSPCCLTHLLLSIAPSSEELYGRKDRDPMPSPNPGLTQATAAEMSFPRCVCVYVPHSA